MDYLGPKVPGQRVPKQTKSLATVCEEVLGILLSKELQCSDWSKRRLTEEQKICAAADARCLVEIFNVFQAKVVREANSGRNCNKHGSSNLDRGLKSFEKSDDCSLVRSTKFVEASNVVRTTMPELCGSIETTKEVDSTNSNQLYNVKSLLRNEQLLEVIETFQLKISEDQIMSRCIKCNGRFIQNPSTTEEAIEASIGFQVIPNCLFNKNLEFWKCMGNIIHQLRFILVNS